MPIPTFQTLQAGPPRRDPGDARSTLAVRGQTWLRASGPAAAASLALHLLALLALAGWIDDRATFPTTEPAVVRFTLAPRPRPEPAPPPEPAEVPTDRPQSAEASEPEPGPELDRPLPEASTRAEPAVAEWPGPESVDEGTPAREAAPTTRPPVDLQQIRQQITTLNFSDSDSDEDTRAGFSSAPDVVVPWARAGDRIRGLPLGGGWLNPWVGPVAARSETWGSVVGEQRGVHVLSNGQVICTRVDAPTNDELMNPWMSMRVTYVRLCGKERGTAPSADDLRFPPPPPMLRKP